MVKTTRRAPDVTLTAEEFAELAQQANEKANETGGTDDATPSEAEEDLARAESDSQQDVLASLMELEGASEARWQIHRVLPPEKAGFVMEMSSAMLSLGSIAAKCGWGKYRVRGFNSKGRYIGMKTITIAEAPEPPAVQPGSSVQDLLAIMREERARSKDDMYKWATLIVPALAPFLPEMVKSLFGRGQSLTELTQALANMKALAGDDRGQLSKVEEFAKMVEVIKGITGGEKESSGKTLYDLIDTGLKEGLPAIAGLVNARRGAAGVVPGAAPGMIAPPPAPRLPAQLTQPLPSSENPMLKLAQWFGAQLPSLVARAAKNSDPELYAEVLLDSVPDGTDARLLRALLARPDWWQQLTAFEPAAVPYQGWFTALHDAIIGMIDDEVRPDTPGTPGAPGAGPVEAEPISNE